MIYSSELIKGTLRTIILKLLTGNKRMYGYEMTQKAKELTSGKIQITEGALYPTLHALEKEGLVNVEIEYIGKRVRKYYILNREGELKAGEKVNEITDFIHTISILLDIKTGNV